MKPLLFFVLTLPMLANSASASASMPPEAARERFEAAKALRTTTLWSCRKGGRSEALAIFRTRPSSSPMFGRAVLTVQDQQICDTLKVICPYVAILNSPDFLRELNGRTFRYFSIIGKYEDAVAFFSEGAGMKAANVWSGSNVAVDWSSTWYFNPGECIAGQL